jgi:rfaE bifunctional protein nucleotidyltransferase chain/domain
VEKILQNEELVCRTRELKRGGRKVVFTNGCFDILHPGHIRYLEAARKMGDALVVAVNSDRSVAELKGPARPILNQEERCLLLAALEAVSYVTVFNEPTPLKLIQSVLPDVLVKGGDWGLNEIVGRKEVEANGGKVISVPYEPGQSSSGIIERILARYGLNAHSTSPFPTP